MTMIRTTLLASLAAGGILAAGCGGSDDKGLAKADLAKKADAICVTYNAKLKAVPEPKSQAELLPYLNKQLPIAEEMGDKIHALKANDDVKAEWNALVKLYDVQTGQAKDAMAALKANDEAKFTQLSNALDATSKQSDAKLDAFGAPHCGSQSDS